jgi:hypothetical protein
MKITGHLDPPGATLYVATMSLSPMHLSLPVPPQTLSFKTSKTQQHPQLP